jgi:uncharacterized membrane protein
MQIVEQSAIINASLEIVSGWMHDLESIPRWTTVQSTVQNPQGEGVGKTYDWHFEVGPMQFSGKIEVVEQHQTSLITRTTGDVDSLWTITLKAINKNSTAIQVTTELTLSRGFVEPLVDVAMQHLGTPEVAAENMDRFKAMVEAHALKLAAEE